MQTIVEQRLRQYIESESEQKQSKCIVFYDTETTGLDATANDQVVELGAVCCHTRKTFERLIAIDPLRFPQYTGKYTGITPSMLVNAPPLSTVLAEFLQWIQSQCDEACTEVVLVAHNNHQFDMLLMERHFCECKINVSEMLRPKLVYADSLPALRHAVRTKVKSFALGKLLPDSLSNVKMHRALVDCQALVIVLFDERFDTNKVWAHMYDHCKASRSV